MQMIESSIKERGLLPLPSAALVIDIRGVSDDHVMEWLATEIADLASEMKTHNVHHWRLLTNFISFRRLSPIKEDSGLIVENEDEGEGEELQGPTGRVYPMKSQNLFLFEDKQSQTAPGNMPFDLFEQKIDELVLEINRMRNNRIAAFNDSDHSGIPGQSIQDATVRVIFLTDVKSHDSLTSAALYADALKEHYRKLNRRDYQEFINTTVLCLGHDGYGGPPTRLINGLMRNNSWSHIDALVLSEDYREDAALIAGTVQAYLAELLLYVLLIIPPFNVSAPELGENGTNHKNGNRSKEKELRLPFHTYVIGLAALEYSSRWGRRWLNFGLAKDVIDLLRQKPTDSTKEKARVLTEAEGWFQNWRERVQLTIPDHVPGDVPALQGVRNAREMGDTDRKVFTSSRFSFTIAQTSIRDLEEYQVDLAKTYSTAGSEPCMESSMTQSTAQVVRVLQEKEQKSLAERQVTELGKLQVEAEQVLSNDRFFQGATGSIPRARTQLWAIGSTVSSFQQQHKDNPLVAKDSVKKKQEQFVEFSSKLIDNFKAQVTRFPLITSHAVSKLAVEILSLVLVMSLTVISILLGFAWLHHFFALHNPGLLAAIDSLQLGIPAFEIVGWGIIALLFVLELVAFRPAIVNEKRKGFWVEVEFLLWLLAFAFAGWVATYSLDALSNLSIDAGSIHYLLLLSSIFPLWGIIAALVAIFLLLIEVGYFFWWLDYLQKERRGIVRKLQEEQQKDLTEVKNFIADDILLEILQRAELTDGNEGLGSYYFRLNELCDVLDEVAKMVRGQQQLAADRLLLNQGTAQQGTGSSSNEDVWLNLHIRDEMLEMEVLTAIYRNLRQSLVSGNDEIRELAELLLRSEGIETVEAIGQQLEERTTKLGEERHRLLLLITTLVAVAMRLAIDPQSIRDIHPVIERYNTMSESSLQETPALEMLVRSLKKEVSQATLQAQVAQHSGADTTEHSLIADTVGTWGEIFWQHQDPRLDAALLQDGVLAQLQRIQQKHYEPRAVMRKLLAHTVLFGRGLKTGRNADVFLLLSPSLQSHRFRQGLKSMRLPRIIDFPDGERILLLGVQRYVAEPLLLNELPPAPVPVSVPVPMQEEVLVQEDEVDAQPEPIVDAQPEPIVDAQPEMVVNPSNGNQPIES